MARIGEAKQAKSRIPGLAGASLLAASAMSCISADLETQTSAALRGIDGSAAAARDWIAGQQLQFEQGMSRVRAGVDGALETARDNAGEAARRLRSRAIVASDACFSTQEPEGCTVAAKAACQRASYGDGAPLASSTYVVCSGLWSLRSADAPEGACKTKRRLSLALCW